MSHVTAGEAIGRLNKLKWANTTAKERLKILEQIQERIEEEMEDLGIEEAESKNMRIGTDDNPYNSDACRLTAVVPLAFCISSAIDMYRLNIAGKPLDPVRVTKVDPHSGLDVIDFGNAEGEGETENEAGIDESQSELEAAEGKDNDEVPDIPVTRVTLQLYNDNKEKSKEEDKSSNDKEAAKEENGGSKMEVTENGDHNQTPEKTPPDSTTPEILPTSPPAEQPAEPPPSPPTETPPEPPNSPPSPPTEAPPEPPKADEETEEKETVDSADVNDDDKEAVAEENGETKLEAKEKENGDHIQTPEKTPPESPTSELLPTSPPAEQPADPPPLPPSSPPPEPPSDPPPEPPSDPPPEPPSDPPPEPPSSPPGDEPPKADDDDDDNNKQTVDQEESQENGDKTSEDEKEKTENSAPEMGLENDESKPSGTPSTKASSTKEEEAARIKITFDPDDEFALIDENGNLPPVYYDVLVSPRTWNEKGYFNARQEHLRIKEFEKDPNGPDCDPGGRVGPYDSRDPQATAVLGSSCHSAAAEIIKALFFDGHVVVYKPHPYNANVDQIWAEILKPLVEIGAVSYCLADQGPELVQDPRIDQIYMTGSEETGQEILKTGKPCVLETGGVNPVILVPGLSRKWGVKELRHHALQIASAGKFNGGHFCGRPQVIVTSKSWDQREEFLVELEKAIAERTPPEGSYDPKYRKTFDRFVHEYPDGKVFEAAGVVTESARVLLVTGASEDSYGMKHEAFCQVLIEVALDTIDHPVAFLPEAVKFCNEKLYGSLCATIVIDDVNNKKYNGTVQQALTDLNYGTVATNAMACFGWFNPGLYWGNFKFDDDDVQKKGVGHFGNLFGYQNSVKSVITDSFTGNGHWIKTSRGAYAEKMLSLSYYALEPSWKKVSAYKYKGVRAAAARKDW